MIDLYSDMESELYYPGVPSEGGSCSSCKQWQFSDFSVTNSNFMEEQEQEQEEA